MHAWTRRLLVLIAIVLGAAALVVSGLPSRRELARKIVGSEPEKPSNLAVAADPALAAHGADSVEAHPSPLPGPSPVETAARKKRERESILALLDEDPRDIRVCAQLGKSKIDPRAKDLRIDFSEAFGAERGDSVMEAYRVPIRAIFQEPSFAGLMREIDRYGDSIDGKPESDRESFLQKMGFYARVARTGATLLAEKGKFERLGDRANHLTVLAKMALLQPSLRDDSRLGDFCRRIQDDDPAPTAESVRAERRDLLALIADMGMKPEDLGFDPEDWTKFSVQSGRHQFSVSLSGKEPPK